MHLAGSDLMRRAGFARSEHLREGRLGLGLESEGARCSLEADDVIAQDLLVVLIGKRDEDVAISGV
jgi:hypothetical protein